VFFGGVKRRRASDPKAKRKEKAAKEESLINDQVSRGFDVKCNFVARPRMSALIIPSRFTSSFVLAQRDARCSEISA